MLGDIPIISDIWHIYAFNGNTFGDIIIALCVFIVIRIGLQIFRSVILRRMEHWALKTKTDIDDHLIEILKGISKFFYFYIALYITIKGFLPFEGAIMEILDAILIILLVYETIKVAQELIAYVFTKTLKQDETTLHAVNLILKIVLWSIGILLILSNLGFDVSTLAASMGIGGIAVALAAQNILGELFASFSIYFDRPFQIGDYICVGTDKGTVKKIGLKSTRLQTLQGEELIISNKELTSVRVQNFKRMRKRRVSFNLGVVYGTPVKKLQQVNTLIEKIITKEENAEFDRCHFESFGDFSLNFAIVYYVKTSDYVEYMNIQQEINYAIADQFEKAKIDMAFPTQTIHMQK